MFESSVVLDGTKTEMLIYMINHEFESSVVLDGTKTWQSAGWHTFWFESSVVLEGTKTGKYRDTFLKVSLYTLLRLSNPCGRQT